MMSREMTNSEAIANLNHLIYGIVSPDIQRSLDLAIKALEERPQGKWKRHDEWVGGEYVGGFYHVNCPCEDGYYSKWETNFCPNCGLPMKKGGAE